MQYSQIGSKRSAPEEGTPGTLDGNKRTKGTDHQPIIQNVNRPVTTETKREPPENRKQVLLLQKLFIR